MLLVDYSVFAPTDGLRVDFKWHREHSVETWAVRGPHAAGSAPYSQPDPGSKGHACLGSGTATPDLIARMCTSAKLTIRPARACTPCDHHHRLQHVGATPEKIEFCDKILRGSGISYTSACLPPWLQPHPGSEPKTD